MQKEKFISFIEDSLSQKEVSLVVLKSEEKENQYKSWLKEKNYHECKDPLEMLKNLGDKKSIFLEYDLASSKDIYDFVLQYPTGQAQLFDTKSMSSVTKNIDFKNRSTILLVTEHQLSLSEKENLDLLSNVGMTFRSEVKHA
ncbi:hypothetical protein COY62_00400 [bacterium (Candidatus Howlettbacteria) CG_4_10_14_0_8_um_filter_40_9]|nr:MAG: hypothetical protein COY62_00400 [bacterium (Candidatus Howlettbacteria) CG_4_10_14_0_8_um_filter_40_9]